MFRKWQYVLGQHPMYWIILHDTECAEREPPWGEKTIEEYIDRLRRNLICLDKYPQLRFSFDLSGVELEDLARRAPDVIRNMRRALRGKQICFVNGTYSQPHSQAFGSESNYRQFEFGLAALRKILGCQVDIYAAQEPGINEQTPQLLNAFGYRYAQVPGFVYVLAFQNEHEILHHYERFPHLDFIHGDEFTDWIGLDGTGIPLNLVNMGDTDYQSIWPEIQKDLFACPAIKVCFHDMPDINDEWIRKTTEYGEFVLLSEALPKRIRDCPPRSSARMYTCWSYTGEGVMAEHLCRTDRMAETRVLQAEAMTAMAWMLVGRPVDDLSRVWKTLLGTQHHDVHWAGGPEVRRKSIGWLAREIRKCDATVRQAAAAISESIGTSRPGGGIPLMVFNAAPGKAKNIVKVPVKFDKGKVIEPGLYDCNGRSIPHQLTDATRFKDQSLKRADICFAAEAGGLGYAAYYLADAKRPQTVNEEKTIEKPFTFENRFYRAKIRPDCTFSSLSCKPTGYRLLKSSKYVGNEFRCRTASGDWLTTRNMSTSMRVTEGPVFTLLRADGELDGAAVEITICLYPQLPWIDLTLRLIFADNSWGTYWIDESKLNVYWPLAFQGEIYHDIAFGAVRGRENRPLHAVNWLDISDHEKGFATVNQGTIKHWVDDSVIANVLAWGHKGDQFTNRLNTQWVKKMDHRLKGEHIIEYSVYPHAGDWRKANVPHVAGLCHGSLIGFQSTAHEGVLPDTLSLLEVGPDNLMPTSIRKVGNHLSCRLYEGWGKQTQPKISLRKASRCRLESVKGEEIKQLDPFQIGHLVVTDVG